MKKLLLLLLITICPVLAYSEVLWVTNNTVNPTAEDSARWQIFNIDGQARSIGHLDTVHINIVNSFGTSVFSETILRANFGTRVKTHVMPDLGVYDTAYSYGGLVADLDGSTPGYGIYTVFIRTAGTNAGDNSYVTITKSEHFYLLPYKLSEQTPAADSVRTRLAILQLWIDSMVTGSEFTDSLINRMFANDDTLFSNLFWERVTYQVLDIMAVDHENAGTTGSLLAYLRPDSLVTVSELLDSLFQSNADTATNSNFAKLMRFANAANVASIRIDSLMWQMGSRGNSWSLPKRANDRDTLFYGIKTGPTSCDTIWAKIYYHIGGYPGKAPDSTVVVNWP